MAIKATDFKCVIFDLDGTLVDTAPDLLDTLNVIFTARGHREITLPEIRSVIGRGAKKMIEEGGRLTGTPFSIAEIEAMFLEYLAHYGAHIADKSRLFPGGREVLEACKKAEIPMAVCTNKLEGLSLSLIEALNLSGYFQTVIGSDTLPTMKPDPAGVNKILKTAGVKAKDALFVGDSETDFKAARAAGTKVVLVDYGYTKTPARELNPDAVISALSELV